jgi:Acetyltransferase (GNAT) domain
VISVSTLEPEGEGAYDRFVRASEDSLFYHCSKYRRLLLDLLRADDFTLTASADGEVRGVLPLLGLDGPAGRVLNSLPYYGSNGGILANDPTAADALAGAYDTLTGASDVAAATMVPNPLASSGQPRVAADFEDERYAHFTLLPPAGIDASARRNVRKALRAGIEVERDAGALEHLHALHEDNIRAIGGRPKELRFFRLVGERFVPGEEYDVWIARRGGEIVAALLLFYWNGVVEYFTPAIAHEARSDQPLAAILDEAMAHAGESGMRVWNWGGTWMSQETLRRFKRKWGAQEKVYAYRTRVNDRTLLDRTAAEILDWYPNFYVVPFAALRSEGDEPSDKS